MSDFDGYAARAWREAFPKPIVTVRMTEQQYDDALAEAAPKELADLEAGRLSGQVVVEGGDR